ncbi:MAG: hypothetical protein ACOCO6_08130 [Segatella copri]
MKSINLIILFLMAVLPNYAYGNQLQQQNNQDKKKKEHKVEVYGDVKDSFTQAYLKAFVTVMDKDSNVIDTMTTSGWENTSFIILKSQHVPLLISSRQNVKAMRRTVSIIPSNT